MTKHPEENEKSSHNLSQFERIIPAVSLEPKANQFGYYVHPKSSVEGLVDQSKKHYPTTLNNSPLDDNIKN